MIDGPREKPEPNAGGNCAGHSFEYEQGAHRRFRLICEDHWHWPTSYFVISGLEKGHGVGYFLCGVPEIALIPLQVVEAWFRATQLIIYILVYVPISMSD